MVANVLVDLVDLQGCSATAAVFHSQIALEPSKMASKD